MKFEEDIQPAIARIHNDRGCIVGTGFLVAEQYVLTCAHVVKAALKTSAKAGLIADDWKEHKLPITFCHLHSRAAHIQRVVSDVEQWATVIFHELDEQNCREDAALLRLPSAPTGIASIELQPLLQREDYQIRSFGFPRGEYPEDSVREGRNLQATVVGDVAGRWWAELQASDNRIAFEPGFSGAPVWCDAKQAVIGMVVARDKLPGQDQGGFMISAERLDLILRVADQDYLLSLLSPYQEALSSQLRRAYDICRPETSDLPIQTSLEGQLKSLEGDGLNRFIACLINSNVDLPPVRDQLFAWLETKTDKVSLLLKEARQWEKIKQPNTVQVPLTSESFVSACLLVSVHAHKDTNADPYFVKAWFVSDINRYDPEDESSCLPLEPHEWEKYADYAGDAPDLEEGVQAEDIPALLAAYLDQVGAEVSGEELTIEIFLPLSLMHKTIEQWKIPGDYGDPVALGLDVDCACVILRSQNRLEAKRSFSKWQKKWRQLGDDAAKQAKDIFLDGDSHSPNRLQSALMKSFGLRLTGRLPELSERGEFGKLIATGTPAALWLRCPDHPQLDAISECFGTEILDQPLSSFPKVVWEIRQHTCLLDDEDDLSSSTELGHHLSFLWEDPNRIPPVFASSGSDYSHEAFS